jgi:hypothetical protein
MVALLGLAIISRSIDDGDRTLWVGLSPGLIHCGEIKIML